MHAAAVARLSVRERENAREIEYESVRGRVGWEDCVGEKRARANSDLEKAGDLGSRMR